MTMKFPFQIIDLTHPVSPDSPGWDLDCGFIHSNFIDYEDCTSEIKFRVQQIHSPLGIGTHMDAPAHCIPGAASITDSYLHRNYLLTQSVLINVSHQTDEHYQITKQDILDFEARYGRLKKNVFVLFYTGWEKHWPNPDKYRNNLVFPSISAHAAQLLLERNIAGIGIDTLSPDTADSGYPVHQLLLQAGKYIIENVANANSLPPIGAWTLALPWKIINATESPVQLIGLV